MLLIKTRAGGEFQWETFDGSLPELSIEGVESIEADGEELVYIKELFSYYSDSEGNSIYACTIPMPKKPLVKWYGDIARTIFINL